MPAASYSKDAAYSYELPRAEAMKVAGLACFSDDGLDVALAPGGASGNPRQPAPQEPWPARGVGETAAADYDLDQIAAARRPRGPQDDGSQ